jgi:hypothetical protein
LGSLPPKYPNSPNLGKMGLPDGYLLQALLSEL